MRGELSTRLTKKSWIDAAFISVVFVFSFVEVKDG